MAVETDERSNISFQVGELKDLGITSTEKIIDAGENFLNGSVDDLIILDKNNEEEELKKPTPKPVDKTNTPPKTITPPTKAGLSEQEAIDLLNGKAETDDDTLGPDGKPKEKEEDLIVLDKDKDKKKPLPSPTPPQATTDAGTEPDDNDVFGSIAEEMVNAGIFEGEDDGEGNIVAPEVKTGEELLQLFQVNARRMAGETIESFLNSKGEEAREVFDNIIVKGVNPSEYISRYAKIQDFKNLDLNDELNQEKVVREFYRLAGSSPESIDRKVKTLKDSSELAAEAEDAHKVVLKREEDGIKELADKKAREDQEKADTRRQYLNSIGTILNNAAKTKDLDGIPVENVREIFDYMTTEKYSLGDQLLTEFDRDILELNRPVNHDLKVKLTLFMRMLKKDPKLSMFSKKVVSKEANQVFQGLKKRNAKAGVTKTSTNAETSTETGGDGKEVTSWFK